MEICETDHGRYSEEEDEEDDEKLEEIEAGAEKARGGQVGSHKRGYSQICQIWDQSFKNRGIRAKGAGRKWYFTAHTEYLRRWHDLERRRSHMVDKTDLKNEWIDRLEMDITVMKKSNEKFEEVDRIYLAKMEEKLELLKHGTDTAISSAVDTMIGKLGARWNVPSRCSDLSSKRREDQMRADLAELG